MNGEKKPQPMDEPARIDLFLETAIPPAENLKGVIQLGGPENFLKVEIVTLFGVWHGYWLIKESGKEKKTPEDIKKPAA